MNQSEVNFPRPFKKLSRPMMLIQLSSFVPKNLNVCCTVPYIALASSLNVKVLQGGVKSSSMRSVHFPKQFASTLVLYKHENFGKPTVKSKKFLSQLLVLAEIALLQICLCVTLDPRFICWRFSKSCWISELPCSFGRFRPMFGYRSGKW
jgi:hypothetical protein